MARAGYDPHARAHAMEQNGDRSRDGATPPKFLSTHPAPKDRIEAIQKNLPRVMPLLRPSKN